MVRVIRSKREERERVLLFLLLMHFSACCQRVYQKEEEKKSVYSCYTTVYKRDNQVVKEREKYIWHIDDGIYQAFFFDVLSCTFAIPIYR